MESGCLTGSRHTRAFRLCAARRVQEALLCSGHHVCFIERAWQHQCGGPRSINRYCHRSDPKSHSALPIRFTSARTSRLQPETAPVVEVDGVAKAFLAFSPESVCRLHFDMFYAGGKSVHTLSSNTGSSSGYQQTRQLLRYQTRSCHDSLSWGLEALHSIIRSLPALDQLFYNHKVPR